MYAIPEASKPPLTLGDQFARVLFGLTCFIWGTSQIAPPGALTDLSLGKIGVGDVTFAVLLVMMITTSGSFRAYLSDFLDRCRTFVILMMLLVTFGVMSAFTNSLTRDLTLPDLIEVIRPGYYMIVALVVSYYARAGFVRGIVFGFAFGVIAAGMENMFLVLTGRIDLELTVMQLYNRNVVGNLIAVAIVYLALAFHFGIQFRSTILLLCALAMVAFSFSKGAWLMGMLGLGCFAVPYFAAGRTRTLRGGTRWLVRLAWIAVIVLAAFNLKLIGKMIELKAQQSFSTQETQSQSTVALRVGHVWSSFEIVSRNPVFGVGVTNWEEENDRNRYWLNDIYLKNDNPHNGFLYVLSGMGIPAFLTFLTLTFFPVVLLPRVMGLSRLPKLVFANCLALLLLVSGNFMLHLLSHYFLWVLIGVCLGLSQLQKEATAAAAIARL